MATSYPCEQYYEKVNSYSLENLPNEIILNIFTHLRIRDLRSCAQVSKNFYAITYDKHLWTKILVISTIPPKDYVLPFSYTPPLIMPHRLLVEALSRGTRYLGLSNLSFISTSQPNFPPTNQVEYLALSGSFMDENYFRELILSCHSLIKLSVPNTRGAWKSEDLLKGILQNSNSLKVLDLSECHKLTYQDIKSILSKCLNLTEVNFSFNWWTLLAPNLSDIFAKLTPNIEKISLPAISINAIKTLLTQCNKLTQLDLTCARFKDEPEDRNVKFPTKIKLESLYMRGFDMDFKNLEMLIPSCENSLQVLDISRCKNMTPQAIQLVVSRCLCLTDVNFCGLKHATFICNNLTPNIERVSLSTTDISTEDIKMLVRRCNKIKELDISHNKIVMREVIDEIILYLWSTLEKLSLPTTYSESTFSPTVSEFDHYPLFKLGSMPKLKYIWSFVRYGTERIMDLWKQQFPDVVLSCHNHLLCQNHCNYTHCSPTITPNPNIAKSMSVEETIWEIPCEGIKLSELQEQFSEENENDASGVRNTREMDFISFSSDYTFLAAMREKYL